MSGIVGGNAGRSSGSVEPAGVVADSITGAEIADDVVDSEHYVAASIDNEHLADNAVGLEEMAGGTDGNIISFDASGDPVYIATGSDGQVLTSAGAGAPPAFEAAAAGGKVLQIKNYAIGTVISGTTNMPDDDSIPQNDEGIECMVLAFTPTSATSRLTITAVVNASSTSSGQWIMALFQDSTASALSTAQVMTSLSAGGHLDTGTLIHDMVADTTSETTFKIRAGWGTTVFYFNGEVSGSRQSGTQGDSLCSRIQIMEYTP
jgi:hypothetical protein